MGVTLRCEKTEKEVDMGYGSFARLRAKVAELHDAAFGALYKGTQDPKLHLLPSMEYRKYFDDYSQKVDKMIEAGKIHPTVDLFCHQADCDGAIPADACKVIFEIVQDYDDDYVYGYAARKNPATFHDFKELLTECIENDCALVWH